MKSNLKEIYSGVKFPYWYKSQDILNAEYKSLRTRAYQLGLIMRPNARIPYKLNLLAPSFPLRFLLEGQTHSGKSVVTRDIEEIFTLDYLKCGIRHPIIHIDYKGNYIGFGKPNINKNHIKSLVKQMGRKQIISLIRLLTIPYPHRVFVPAYAVPLETAGATEIVSNLHKEYGVTDIWRMDWRTILDLRWLGDMFNIMGTEKWISLLQDPFNKCVAEKKWKFNEVVGVGGFLDQQIAKIDQSTASRKAAEHFLNQWRRMSYLFAEEDSFSKVLDDDFSYNVVTFKPTYQLQTQNAIAFILLLQGIIKKLQEIKRETQPLIVISDALVPIGKKSILKDEATRAVSEIVHGFGRSGNVGFCIIIEVQSPNELDKSLQPSGTNYTHIFKLNPLVSNPKYIGDIRIAQGKCEVTDNILNLKDELVYMRPPLTEYHG